MKTNKPEIKGVILRRDASCTSTWNDTEPLICLSDYEALQAELKKWKHGSKIRDKQNRDLYSIVFELKAECEKLKKALKATKRGK